MADYCLRGLSTQWRFLQCWGAACKCRKALRKLVQHQHFHRYGSLRQSGIGIPAPGSVRYRGHGLVRYYPAGISHEFVTPESLFSHFFTQPLRPHMILNGVKWINDDLGVKSTLLYKYSPFQAKCWERGSKALVSEAKIWTGRNSPRRAPVRYTTEYRSTPPPPPLQNWVQDLDFSVY